MTPAEANALVSAMRNNGVAAFELDGLKVSFWPSTPEPMKLKNIDPGMGPITDKDLFADNEDPDAESKRHNPREF